MMPAERELMAEEILRQARMPIEEGECLILVTDGRAGVVPLDEELAQLLRATGKPLVLAVNKIDSVQHLALLGDFHRLGIPETFPISAEHGLGVDDLLDHLTARWPADGARTTVEPAGDRSQQLIAPGEDRPDH